MNWNSVIYLGGSGNSCSGECLLEGQTEGALGLVMPRASEWRNGEGDSSVCCGGNGGDDAKGK